MRFHPFAHGFGTFGSLGCPTCVWTVCWDCGDEPPVPHPIGVPAVQQLLKNVRVAVRLPIVIILSLASLVVFATVAMNTISTGVKQWHRFISAAFEPRPH